VESTLCEELGVQRFIIRDVLKRLASERLVVYERYKGCFVAEVSFDEAFDTYQVHAFLEGGAALLATKNLLDKDLDKLEVLIEKSKEIDPSNWEIWVKYNRQIHGLVNKACGNDKLIELIKGNVKYMKYWFIVLSTYADLKRRNEEHIVILRFLRERNAGKVRQAVENHIIEAGKDMRKRLEKILPVSEKRGIELRMKAR
jgi:DNA-binding GntR family transcriptional regulator